MALKVTDEAVLALLRSDSTDDGRRELDGYAQWAQDDARRGLEAAVPHLVDDAEHFTGELVAEPAQPTAYEMWCDALMIAALSADRNIGHDALHSDACSVLELLKAGAPA